MAKVGASFSDKNKVKRMHLAGDDTPQQIAVMCNLRLDTVEAIIKQVTDGTLKLAHAVPLRDETVDTSLAQNQTDITKMIAENKRLNAKVVELMTEVETLKRLTLPDAPEDVVAVEVEIPDELESPAEGEPTDDPVAESDAPQATKRKRRRPVTPSNQMAG